MYEGLTRQQRYQHFIIKRLAGDLTMIVDLLDHPPTATDMNVIEAIEAACNWIRVAHNELQNPTNDAPAINP